MTSRPVLAVLVVCVTVAAACGRIAPHLTDHATRLDTSGLTSVDISSDAPVSPPFNHHHATLSSQSGLVRFQQSVAAHGLELRPYGSVPIADCAGGASWTLILTRRNGPASTINLMTCGSVVRSNVTGRDLPGFLREVSAIAGLT